MLFFEGWKAVPRSRDNRLLSFFKRYAQGIYMNVSPTGSEAAALIARLDWARSPLGDAIDWPQSLRTAVDIVIHSPMPMLLLWGAELTQIYNDGFAMLAGNSPLR